LGYSMAANWRLNSTYCALGSAYNLHYNFAPKVKKRNQTFYAPRGA
jgi:hypothetical protein